MDSGERLQVLHEVAVVDFLHPATPALRAKRFVEGPVYRSASGPNQRAKLSQVRGRATALDSHDRKRSAVLRMYIKLAELDGRYNRRRMHLEEDTIQRLPLLPIGRAAVEAALTVEEAWHNEPVRWSAYSGPS